MKIIITESQYNMLRLQRRLGYVDEYMSNLDRNDICDYWSKDEIREYVDSSMANIVEQLCEQIGTDDLYEYIYQYLIDNGYQSQFRDFFIDTYDNYCSK
jgi:hypothetical protein